MQVQGGWEEKDIKLLQPAIPLSSPGRAGSRALWWQNRRGRSLKLFQIPSPRTPKQSVRSDSCQNIRPLIRVVLPLKFSQLPCEVRISLLQLEAHLCWECHCPGGMADFGGVLQLLNESMLPAKHSYCSSKLCSQGCQHLSASIPNLSLRAL